MKYAIRLLPVLLLPAVASAQTVWAGLTTYGGTAYDKTFGMDMSSTKIVQTLFTRSYRVAPGLGNDFIVMVNNPAGGSYWEMLVGKPDTNEWTYDVAFLTDGNAIAAGVSCIPYGGSPNNCEFPGRAYIIKMSQYNGEILWSKWLVDAWGTPDAWIRIFDVEPTSDGGFVVGGEIEYDYTWYDYDAFVAKFDSDGNLEWNRIYGTLGMDWISSVFQTADGNIVAIAPVFDEIWMAKMDITDGTVLWQRSFSRDVAGSTKYFSWAYPTSDGGFILADEIDGGSGGKDILFLKFLGDGTLQFAKQIGSSGLLDDAGVDAVEGNSYYYITGLFRYDNTTIVGDLFIGYMDKLTGDAVKVRYILSSDDEQGRAIGVNITDTTEVPYVAGYTDNPTWSAGNYDGLLAADSGTVDTCYWRTAVDTLLANPTLGINLGTWTTYSNTGIIVESTPYLSAGLNTANSVTCGILTPISTDETYQDCRYSITLTRNMLTIKAKDGSDISFALFTPSGKLVMKRDYKGVSYIREYVNLNPGIYVLKLNDTVSKFVVK